MMPLDQWDREVRVHLVMIEAGAQICVRHVMRLPARPRFESKAEDELRHCEAVLEKALGDVRGALAAYHDKEVDQ